MALKTMFPASAVQPFTQYSVASNLSPLKTGWAATFAAADVSLLRDNFTIQTWILIGCVIQTGMTFILPRSYAAFPAILLLLWGITDALLMSLGLKQNLYMKDVILGKFSVAYPDPGEEEVIHSRPAENGPGAVMMLATQSNGPLGMFTDGFKEVGDRFRDMIAELEKDKETNGFMGMSSWLGASERATNNEYMTISYWRSVEDIHQWALSPLHRDAWKWWNATLEKHNMVAIMHEIYEVPKHNGWEGIYVNYKPTSLAATTRLVNAGQKGGDARWVNPVIDARKGVYRTSHGRMSKGDEDGSGNDKVAKDPYAQV